MLACVQRAAEPLDVPEVVRGVVDGVPADPSGIDHVFAFDDDFERNGFQLTARAGTP